MGFLQAIFETKAAAKNAIPRATGASPALNQIGLGAVGPWDTENAIKAGYERVIWIFRCVDVISQNQASLKINLVKGLDRGLQKQEIIESPRLNKVLNFRANTYESSWQFRYRLSSQLLLSRRGAFIEIIKGRDGLPSELHLLPPQATEPIPDAKKFVSGYKVKRSDYDYDELKPEQVIWVKLKPHPTDPYQQMTPLVAAGIEADTDFLARLFNRNFLANDGRPGMLITIDPGATPLDPVDAETIKARFSGGPSHAGQTTVIEAAGINAEDLSASPRDIQWDTLLSSSKERLLMAFGVPESVMGNASGRTFDNADAERENFWLDTMFTHCNGIASALDPLSGDSTDEQVFAFNYEEVEVLQRMAARKREEWRAEVAAGVRTIDSYFEATGDMPWDVLETRILMKPNGVFIGSTPADIEAAKKIVPISATPAQPPMDGGGGAFGAPPMQNGGFMPVQSQQRFDNAANELSVAARALAISQRKSGKRRPETKGHRALRVVGSPPAAEDDPEAVPDVDVLLFEAELAGVLTAWDQQQEKVIPARLDHAKVRKGTRHWEGFEGETKALSTAYIVEVEQWIMQVRDAMQELVKKHIEREARKALAKLRRTGILDTMLALDKASGVGVGAEAAFPDPFSHAAAMNLVYMNSMEIVDNAVRRQSQRVARKITEMDNSGKPLTDIKAEVRRMLGARAQWRRSLATNVATSVTEGTKEAVYSRSEGLMTKTWRTHADERVRTAHRLLEGQQPAADGLWHTAIGNLRFPGDPLAPPALTVNCFPATTKVRGQINGAYRSEYEGDLVTITTGHGVELTGTPNHPILTGRGWVPLKDIQKGDHVVRHVGEGQAVVGHHVDAVPLMIGKVFDALSQSFPLVRHTGSRVDFHGDIPTGEVDVVLADGQLRNDWYTPADHFIRQFLFPSTDSYAGLSMAGRTLLQRGKRVLLPPASTVGSLSVGSTLVGRQSLHPKDIGFRDTASVNVVAGQVTAERIATDTGFLSQGILGLPGKVALDEVRSVDVQRFSGHVYNLSTMTGAYTSNSIIAHNCRCWVEHIPNFDALVAAYA
jgi:HK97 family phage portal protein